MSLTDLLTPSGPDGARTRVLRHRSSATEWAWWLRKPAPLLSELVASLWVWDGEADDNTRHREMPTAELGVAFTLGLAARVVDGAGVGSGGQDYRGAWVSGVQERPMTVESSGRTTRILSVQLRPLGAWAFFGGLPLRGLTNHVVDLESVVGGRAGVEPLRQRLLDTRDFGAALDLVEEWLARRAFAGPRAHPVTRAAMAYLGADHGDMRVQSLARALGVSSRHLNGLFHREVGVSAKRMARLLRFERAMGRLAGGAVHDLAALAHECGYYDQPHMNRDFRELGDVTPTECLTAGLPLARPD